MAPVLHVHCINIKQYYKSLSVVSVVQDRNDFLLQPTTNLLLKYDNYMHHHTLAAQIFLS